MPVVSERQGRSGETSAYAKTFFKQHTYSHFLHYNGARIMSECKAFVDIHLVLERGKKYLIAADALTLKAPLAKVGEIFEIHSRVYPKINWGLQYHPISVMSLVGFNIPQAVAFCARSQPQLLANSRASLHWSRSTKSSPIRRAISHRRKYHPLR